VSVNPSVSHRPSLNAEESLKEVESVAFEETLREARKSQVSILGTGISLTQDWTSLRDDKHSERNDSQVESLQAVTEIRQQSVKEVPVVYQDRENLKESVVSLDPMPVSQVAGSLNDVMVEHQHSEPYLSENQSVSHRTFLNQEKSYQDIQSVHSDQEIPGDARHSQLSIRETALSMTQGLTSMRDGEDSERYDSQVESQQAITEKREQSVKEVPVFDRDQENLLESNLTVDPSLVSQIAVSQKDYRIEDQKSESYKSENPSFSGRSSIRGEDSCKGIESFHNYESVQRDFQQSKVSILETVLSMTQQWTSLQGSKYSDRHDSQVESLQAITEKREQSVKEVPVINESQENLQ
jgi:hypothetical protein